MSGWSVFSREAGSLRHKTRPLAGRGVDGRVLPAMLRLATHGAYQQETGALQNGSTVSVAPNWFGR